MPDTPFDFEQRYAEFASSPGGSARRRARNPENWEMIRLLVAQIDAGLNVSPDVETDVRRWLQVAEHRERRRVEFARLSSLTIEDRFAELSVSVEEYVGRPGTITANRRIEGDRFVQGIKLLFELEGEFPENNRELMIASLNRYQGALEGKLRVEPTSKNNPKMRVLLDQRISRATKNLNRIQRIYKVGDASARRDIRHVRDSAIRNLESLLQVDYGKLNPEQALLARATLEKLKAIKPPKGASYAWVQVVPGGLPTMGRGRK